MKGLIGIVTLLYEKSWIYHTLLSWGAIGGGFEKDNCTGGRFRPLRNGGFSGVC
jgi:hypothetical protein